jgi:hypothetical protein
LACCATVTCTIGACENPVMPIDTYIVLRTVP